MTEEELKELFISQAEEYCNTKFNRDNLPAGVTLYVKSKLQNANKDASVQSKKLSDMSITYFSRSEMTQDELGMLKPYMKMKVL